MKTLIIILVILSFLQSTIIPMDLVLMVLVLRSYVVCDRSNLILAFIFGLLAAHLTFTPLGFASLLYLVLTLAAQVLNRSPLSHNPLVVFPAMLVFLSLNELIISLSLHQSINIWPKVAIEAFISLPIYLLVRVWEERFVVKPELRLKI